MTDTGSVTMVERVARALHRAANQTSEPPEDDRHLIAWEDLPDAWQDDFRLEARAAIEAMREPTEKMLRACPIVGTGPDGNGNWAVNSKPAQAMWPAMINAALTEGKIDE